MYRLSFSLFIFHLLCLSASLVTGTFSNFVNRGCWIFKIGVLAAFFIVTFFIPNSFFQGYKEFSRYASILYLIVQVIIYIDFSYAWNESWIKNYEESEGNLWPFCLFFFSGVMWVAALTTSILNYFWFTSDACGVNIFLATQTIVFGALLTLFSISPWVEHGSLLTSSAVNLYLTYLAWSGMASEPNEHG